MFSYFCAKQTKLNLTIYISRICWNIFRTINNFLRVKSWCSRKVAQRSEKMLIFYCSKFWHFRVDGTGGAEGAQAPPSFLDLCSKNFKISQIWAENFFFYLVVPPHKKFASVHPAKILIKIGSVLLDFNLTQHVLKKWVWLKHFFNIFSSVLVNQPNRTFWPFFVRNYRTEPNFALFWHLYMI